VGAIPAACSRSGASRGFPSAIRTTQTIPKHASATSSVAPTQARNGSALCELTFCLRQSQLEARRTNEKIGGGGGNRTQPQRLFASARVRGRGRTTLCATRGCDNVCRRDKAVTVVTVGRRATIRPFIPAIVSPSFRAAARSIGRATLTSSALSAAAHHTKGEPS
jgi:hypothetical protein